MGSKSKRVWGTIIAPTVQYNTIQQSWGTTTMTKTLYQKYTTFNHILRYAFSAPSDCECCESRDSELL